MFTWSRLLDVAVVTLSAGLTAAAAVTAKSWREQKPVEDQLQQHIAIKDLDRESPAFQAKELIQRWKQTNNIPGVVIGVSKRGQTVWHFADGYADIENSVRCHRKTVMRIASISKPIAALMMMKLVEEGKLNLDKPISEYLSEDIFPKKLWDGKPVDLTLRQLASHTAGIRHYKKGSVIHDFEPIEKQTKNGDKNNSKTVDDEFASPEYFLKDHFKSLADALNLFKDDPLVAKPGTKYNYSTFSFTLLSAVVESALDKEPYGKALEKFVQQKLGMTNTWLDLQTRITNDRACYYMRSSDGRLINAPHVNSSYKWAGGGLLSNVDDLVRFGNIMLYSFKPAPNGRPGFLKRETVDQMWRPVEVKQRPNKDWDGGYGIGWVVLRDAKSKFAFCSEPPMPNASMHSGGAIGASSMLVIEPDSEVVVAMLVNKGQANGIVKMAVDVAKLFAAS